MTVILRLCLHAVDANGERIRVWLSFSVLHATSPTDIVRLAEQNVQQRMAAKFEAYGGKSSQLGLCVRDARGQFLFLGAPHMEMAKVPLTKMPFVAELLREGQQKARGIYSKSSEEAAWERFVFLQGALVPLSDLQRLNRRASPTADADANGGDGASFPSMYEAVRITPELSSDPFDPDSSPLQRHSFPGSSTADAAAAAGKGEGHHASVLVHYVDFMGRKYQAVLQRTVVRSLHTLMCAACQNIGSQVGCAFEPSNMTLMLEKGQKNICAVENDVALREALNSENACLYLAVNSRLLSSQSPERYDTSLHEPELPLRESRGAEKDAGLLHLDAPQSVDAPWALATSAATIRQLGSISPAPTFAPSERQSVLRMRPAAASMREEEDNIRLRLASTHFRMDEVLRNHTAVTLGADRSAPYKALVQQKAMLMEELTECMSAERDCQRLENLVSWLEKDVMDGRMRQEKLVRALYA